MKINKFGLTVLLCSTVCGFNAMGFETAARNAILMDYDTGEYLFEKNIAESYGCGNGHNASFRMWREAVREPRCRGFT